MEAFDRLIVRMPLEEVTVSAIAREADVDRKTFYQHFGTIDGLLDAVAESVVEDLLDDVEHSVRNRSAFGDGPASIRVFFEALAERLGEDLELGEGYCDHLPLELIVERLARPLMAGAVERGLVGAVPSDRREPLLVFGTGGILALYRWWLTSDGELSIADLMDLAGELIENGASPYLF